MPLRLPTWLRRRQRSGENPNIPLDAKAWQDIFGTAFESISGETITTETAVECAAWWQGLSIISGDVGRLPLQLVRQEDDEPLRRAEDSRASLVGFQPNEFFAADQFWSRVMLDLLQHGRAAVEIIRNLLGQPVRLLKMNSAILEPGVDPAGNVVMIERRTVPNVVPARDCLYLEWMGHGDLDVRPTYRAARQVLGVALGSQRFSSTFFKHGGRVGGILMLPAGMPKPAKDTVAEDFVQAYGNEAFKVVPLRDGAEFRESQRSPEESQLVETQERSARDVARLLNLPASKLNLSDGRSYNSKSEDNRDYLENTLARFLRQIELQCDIKLLEQNEQDELAFRYDTSQLLRMSRAEQVQTEGLAIEKLISNPNESRKRLKMGPPYPGGEVFRNPNTSTEPEPG